MTDFSMFQGDTKVLELTVRDIDGVVVDISGASSIRWALARNAKMPTAKLTKSLGAGIALVGGGTTGRCDITLSPSDTSDLTPTTYYHETEIIIGGVVATIDSGSVTILQALIKPA